MSPSEASAAISRSVAARGDDALAQAQGMADGLAFAFGGMVLVLVIACVLTATLPARPLRTTAFVDDPTPDPHGGDSADDLVEER